MQQSTDSRGQRHGEQGERQALGRRVPGRLHERVGTSRGQTSEKGELKHQVSFATRQTRTHK